MVNTTKVLLYLAQILLANQFFQLEVKVIEMGTTWLLEFIFHLGMYSELIKSYITKFIDYPTFLLIVYNKTQGLIRNRTLDLRYGFTLPDGHNESSYIINGFDTSHQDFGVKFSQNQELDKK